MKRILAVLMTLVMVFAMTACGNNGSASTGSSADGSAGTITVEIDIDYPDESGIADVEDMKIDVPEGSTVLDALNAYADANNCEILMDEASQTPYVVSIGGVAATDTAGWVYEVNDEMVMESADACVLKAHDEVSWEFESWAD